MTRKTRQSVLSIKEAMGVLRSRLDESKAALMADADRERESYIRFRTSLLAMTDPGYRVLLAAKENPEDAELETQALAIEATWRQRAEQQIADEEADVLTHYEPEFATPTPPSWTTSSTESLDAAREGSPMPNKQTPLDRAIATTEAETVLLQIKTRHELLKACHQLMPKAIREAKGIRGRKARGDKPARPGKRGSPALLRLISRIVLRPISTKSSTD